MILHPYSFLLTRPGGHGGDEETQRLLTSIAELKVRSRQNCEADPRTYLDNLRSVSLLPPDLALPLEEIPNFLDCFMTNSQGDARVGAGYSALHSLSAWRAEGGFVIDQEPTHRLLAIAASALRGDQRCLCHTAAIPQKERGAHGHPVSSISLIGVQLGRQR